MRLPKRSPDAVYTSADSCAQKRKPCALPRGPPRGWERITPPKRGQLLRKLISRKLAEEKKKKRKRNDPKVITFPLFISLVTELMIKKERRTLALAPCYEWAESGARGSLTCTCACAAPPPNITSTVLYFAPV